MRRHFSLQRLALVVAWAALAPKCALLVQSWTGLLPQATVSDAVRVAAEFQGKWNRWSDRAGRVAENPASKNTAGKNTAAENLTPDHVAAEASRVGNIVAVRKVTETMASAANVPKSNFPPTFDRATAEAEVVRAGFPSARDVAARRISRTLPTESRRVPNLPSVVIR